MKTELEATRSQSFPTLAFAGAGFCAAGESSLALLWRRVRVTGVKGVLSRYFEETQRRSNVGFISESCHFERTEESAPDDSKLVDPSQDRLRMTDGKNTKEQIAMQKRLAMTELSGPRCTRTALTTRTPLQVAG
jgi:hypothetical protein